MKKSPPTHPATRPPNHPRSVRTAASVVNHQLGRADVERSSGLVAPGVASTLWVREVADPKCRCAGVGRPRWILETPRSALPDPHLLLGQRRRAAGGRSR